MFTLPTLSNFSVPLTLICVLFLFVWHKGLTWCVLIRWMVPRTLIWCHRTHWGHWDVSRSDARKYHLKMIFYHMKNASLNIYYSHSLCPGTTYLEQTWVKPKGKQRNSCIEPPWAMSKHMRVKQRSLFKPMSLGQWCLQGHRDLIWGCAVCQWSAPFYQSFKVSTVILSPSYTLGFMPTLIICGDQWKETLSLRFWMMSPKQTVLTSRKKKVRERYLNPLNHSNLK